MIRLLISILLLLVVAWMAGPVSAGDGDSPRSLRISISPVSGNNGSEITVTGNGAVPEQLVVVTLSPQPDTAEGAFATATVTPEADGAFSVSLIVPPDLSEGRYYVRAEQLNDNGNVIHYYYNAFIVGAAGGGNFLPETGTIQGTPFTITAALALLLLVGLVTRGIYALVVRL